MEEKRLFFKCLAGKLAIFLLLWGAVMATAVYINGMWVRQDIEDQIQACQEAARPAEMGAWQSAALTVTGGGALDRYGGQVLLRLYDQAGEQIGQSQLLAGHIGLSDQRTDSPSAYLLIDPALSDGQLLEAVRILAQRGLDFFRGPGEDGKADFYGVEVVGWLSERVIYVQKLTLCFGANGAERVTLADTEADLFPGREPETFTSAWVQFYTPLLGRGGPEKRLADYRAMEEELDRDAGWIVEHHGIGGKLDGTTVHALNSNVQVYGIAGDGLAALSWRVSPFYPLAGLEGALLGTLGMAAALALFTAWLEYRAIRRERAFTRAAAHELKTPLAILRAHAESLKEDIDPAKREEYLDVVLSETDRMAALTAALLDLARLERGEALNREPVELSALVKGVFDRLVLPLEQKGITLKLDLSPVWTEGDRSRLESAAANLASNALRHCPSGGIVTVKAGKEGRWAALTVDNDGDNIPERELRLIWQPFYRSGRSRSRDTGGNGLGLAIVKAAVKAHGGACSASNREGGVTFRVSLPCLQSAQ